MALEAIVLVIVISVGLCRAMRLLYVGGQAHSPRTDREGRCESGDRGEYGVIAFVSEVEEEETMVVDRLECESDKRVRLIA